MSKKVTKEALKPRAGDAFPLLSQTILTAICPPAGFVAALLQVYLGDPASRRATEFLESIDNRLYLESTIDTCRSTSTYFHI
ncbi:MAG: hypothetical protein GXY86_06325 [Firmicutes bacterium]|nr:hypothetical protein [Bacillota bacterium]